jgi:hypothetical protein
MLLMIEALDLGFIHIGFWGLVMNLSPSITQKSVKYLIRYNVFSFYLSLLEKTSAAKEIEAEALLPLFSFISWPRAATAEAAGLKYYPVSFV